MDSWVIFRYLKRHSIGEANIPFDCSYTMFGEMEGREKRKESEREVKKRKWKERKTWSLMRFGYQGIVGGHYKYGGITYQKIYIYIYIWWD